MGPAFPRLKPWATVLAPVATAMILTTAVGPISHQSPPRFLLQLFMTPLASYVTASVFAAVTLVVILRAIYVRRVD
jgi:hypothetical protein